MSKTLKIWLFTDGKTGHEKQSRAFLEMLGKKYSIREQFIDVSNVGWTRSFLGFLGINLPITISIEKPDIIIGTGHGTHLPMLAARRIHQGKVVVIMKPSLPLQLFDLCIIPMHDKPPSRDNVVITNGPISTIKYSKEQDERLGLIMLGGPSKHFSWSNEKVLFQILEIIMDSSNRDLQWDLTTSRRTPPSIIEKLRSESLANLSLHSFEETPPGWIEKKLLSHGQVWVTQDSFSMVHEAVQSGAKVGLLELPANRISSFTHRHKFKRENIEPAVSFSEWQRHKTLKPSTRDKIKEDDICAQSMSILSI